MRYHAKFCDIAFHNFFELRIKVDFLPSFSSTSNRLIHAKDHASIQINIAEVDPVTGRMSDTSKVYTICGAIRRMGESDDCIARLAKKDGIVAKYVN